MHCFSHENLSPDVVTFGKGLGGGLALSAVVGPAPVLDVAQAFAMETTCGNPISAAAGLAVLQTIQDEDLSDRAAELGRFFYSGLQRLASSHPLVGDIRGRGLVLGLELVRDRESQKPAAIQAAKVVYRAYELGAVLYYVGLQSNVLEFTPPLIIGNNEIEKALEILDDAISDVEHNRIPDEAIRDFQGW
jgi:4-aminobutyrate aminotransferase